MINSFTFNKIIYLIIYITIFNFYHSSNVLCYDKSNNYKNEIIDDQNNISFKGTICKTEKRRVKKMGEMLFVYFDCSDDFFEAKNPILAIQYKCIENDKKNGKNFDENKLSSGTSVSIKNGFFINSLQDTQWIIVSDTENIIFNNNNIELITSYVNDDKELSKNNNQSFISNKQIEKEIDTKNIINEHYINVPVMIVIIIFVIIFLYLIFKFKKNSHVFNKINYSNSISDNTDTKENSNRCETESSQKKSSEMTRHETEDRIAKEEEKAILLTLSRGPKIAFEELCKVDSIQYAITKPLAIKTALQNSMPALVDKALEDNHLSEAEQLSILNLIELCGLTTSDFDNDITDRLAKASIVRDLLAGKPRPQIEVAPSLQFYKLQKSEILIWYWGKAKAFTQKTIKKWVGGSRGISFRIMKGVYYRLGNTKGNSYPVDVVEDIGVGPLAITNKHIFFQGKSKIIRLKLDKIIGLERCSDGVILHQEGERKKPIAITVDEDPWFLINCIANAEKWN